MAAVEKEGKKAWERRRGRKPGREEGDVRIWGLDARREEGGREEEEEQLFVRSGRGSGDHVNFF
jgi:hypothetical protein